jgi:SAM-dependent methyltransferase
LNIKPSSFISIHLIIMIGNSFRKACQLGMPVSRGLSAAAAVPSFSGEVADTYERLFVQHKHERGPWNKIINEVGRYTQGNNKVSLLDLASGPGEPGLSIAQRYPHVDVTVTDISPDQVEKAKSRSREQTNVQYAVSDLQDLSAFPDNSFDVVTCCYGYMFCEDTQKAFDETYRVMKPGGMLVATYWIKLPTMDLVCATMKGSLRGQEPPTPDINPLSLSAPGKVSNFVEKSGFVNPTIQTSDYPFHLGNDRDIIFKTGTIPVLARLLDMKNSGQVEEYELGVSAFWNEVKAHPKVDHDKTEGSVVVNGCTFELLVCYK